MNSMERKDKRFSVKPRGRVGNRHENEVSQRGRAKSKRTKTAGLRRPKTSLSFQIPSTQGHKDTSDGSNNALAINSLEKHVLMLNLIIRRNKNQHRNQAFFKYICQFRASLRKLLAVQNQLRELQANMSAAVKADDVRQRFEREAGLRGQREVLQEHIREVLVPKCFASASALVGDSQFANLGLVLVALVADVAAGDGGVGLPEDNEEREELAAVYADPVSTSATKILQDDGERYFVEAKASLIGTSTRMTGEDQGEVIERRYDHDSPAIRNGVISNNEREVPAQAQASIEIQRTEAECKQLSEGVMAQRDRKTTGEEVSEPTDQWLLQSTKDETDGNSLKKKNSKKRKNAIDDIFSSLL